MTEFTSTIFHNFDTGQCDIHYPTNVVSSVHPFVNWIPFGDERPNERTSYMFCDENAKYNAEIVIERTPKPKHKIITAAQLQRRTNERMNIDCLNTKNSARPNCGRNSFPLKWNPILSFRFAHETMLLCCIVGILFANAGTLVQLHTHTPRAQWMNSIGKTETETEQRWCGRLNSVVYRMARVERRPFSVATASDEMKILFELS